MISRGLKAMYYAALGPAMRVNGEVRRRLHRVPAGSGPVRVHLGPGQDKYMEGWVNVDANFVSAKIDVWADLRNPLPFPENSVDAFYSHHMIEHLPNVAAHFVDMYRCLRPGGMIRVGGPHGDVAIERFQADDNDWFGDFPDSRRSIGGRFENFIFCRQEHLTILTRSFLREICEDAGFVDIEERQPVTETGNQDYFSDCLGMENEPTPEHPHTLLIEARKPAS